MGLVHDGANHRPATLTAPQSRASSGKNRGTRSRFASRDRTRGHRRGRSSSGRPRAENGARARGPDHFGVQSAPALTKAVYFERIPGSAVSSLSQVIFEKASAGDCVARAIIDRLAALVRRLKLGHLDPEIVLGGGFFKAEDAPFFSGLEAWAAQ